MISRPRIEFPPQIVRQIIKRIRPRDIDAVLRRIRANAAVLLFLAAPETFQLPTRYFAANPQPMKIVTRQ
jgi:hypothetical protein